MPQDAAAALARAAVEAAQVVAVAQQDPAQQEPVPRASELERQVLVLVVEVKDSRRPCIALSKHGTA
jgi:hypothetical protein